MDENDGLALSLRQRRKCAHQLRLEGIVRMVSDLGEGLVYPTARLALSHSVEVASRIGDLTNTGSVFPRVGQSLSSGIPSPLWAIGSDERST